MVELMAIAGVLDAYEARRWPEGKAPGRKGNVFAAADTRTTEVPTAEPGLAEANDIGFGPTPPSAGGSKGRERLCGSIMMLAGNHCSAARRAFRGLLLVPNPQRHRRQRWRTLHGRRDRRGCVAVRPVRWSRRPTRIGLESAHREGLNAAEVLRNPQVQASHLKVAREEINKALAIIEQTRW